MSPAETATAIDRAIAANEAAQVDRLARYKLDSLSDKLRKYRCNISKLSAEEAAIYCGVNMRGPSIEDLIWQSEWFREHGTVQMGRAA